MKVKKYLCIMAVVTISVCTVVFGLPFFTDNTIVDALTRPSEETASLLLSGIQSVWVEIEIRSNICSHYERLSSKNLSSDISKQLKEKTDVVVKKSGYTDGRILADIQLKRRKETEFVAVSIAVSVAERVELERFDNWYFTGITWQSRRTLLVHKNEIMEEVPKNLQYLVRHLCTLLPHHRKAWEKLRLKKQKDEKKQ